MAPIVKASKADAVWRDAWVATPYTGTVDVEVDDETGLEHLIVRCKDVVAEHGQEARVLNDGRTVGVAVGERVFFGAVKRLGKAPIAVNISRKPTKKKRAEEDDWEEEPDAKRQREEEGDWVGPPALPDAVVGDLVGVVRNQSPRTEDYFIQCDKVHRTYGRDAKIRVHEMPQGITIGCAIVFEVEPPVNENCAPVARNVRRADDDVDAQKILAEARARKGGAKGTGKAPQRFGGIMRMVGIVKRASPRTGRHFIFCQDISDVYGQDAQVPLDEIPKRGLKIGDRISFDVEEPPEGRMGGFPLARNIRHVGSKGGAKPIVNRNENVDVGDGEDDFDDDAQLEDADEEDLGEEKPLAVGACDENPDVE